MMTTIQQRRMIIRSIRRMKISSYSKCRNETTSSIVHHRRSSVVDNGIPVDTTVVIPNMAVVLLTSVLPLILFVLSMTTTTTTTTTTTVTFNTGMDCDHPNGGPLSVDDMPRTRTPSSSFVLFVSASTASTASVCAGADIRCRRPRRYYTTDAITTAKTTTSSVSSVSASLSFVVPYRSLSPRQLPLQQQQQHLVVTQKKNTKRRPFVVVSHHHQQQQQQQQQRNDDTENDDTTSNSVSTAMNTRKPHQGGLSSQLLTNFRTTTIPTLLLWMATSLFLILPPTTVPGFNTVASAATSSYGSLSTEQRVVAEAWRLVDNSFLDRTFHHQDWFAVRQKYVVQTKYSTMAEAQTAIATMVQTLGDKYTRYLTPSQYQSLVDSATGVLSNGNGGGVGIEIRQNPDTHLIYASDVQENSPAAKAGIQINDIFVQVDGQSIITATPPTTTTTPSTSEPTTTVTTTATATTTNTPDDVARLLRGPIQSKVGIVMRNPNTNQNVDYIIQRQPITITAVQSYLSTTNQQQRVGVIRIKNFSSTTASVVQTALEQLESKGVKSYLIDVRGNPGGLLPGGVDTAALFLPNNVPVVTVVNKSGIADPQCTIVAGIDTTTPVTILVDHETASAAEVFTAALQENHRATVVGEQTFGKGIVQTIRELSDKNGGIAITVARYETPNHQDINARGITVDIPTPVDCSKKDATLCIKNIPNVFQSPTTTVEL